MAKVTFRSLGWRAGACGAALAFGVLASDAWAQAPTPADPHDPPAQADPGQPAAPPDPLKALQRQPKTAADKAKLLGDLYALLATADDQNQASRISRTIERLWFQSGSDTVTLLMSRASDALKHKQFDSALKFMDYVCNLAPDYAEGFNRRAFVHYSQGDYKAAVGDLRRALALEPNHYKALDGLAQIWRQTGNKKGALAVLKQLLEVNPNWAGARQAADELSREVEGQGI